jgi:hypothetical protein
MKRQWFLIKIWRSNGLILARDSLKNRYSNESVKIGKMIRKLFNYSENHITLWIFRPPSDWTQLVVDIVKGIQRQAQRDGTQY